MRVYELLCHEGVENVLGHTLGRNMLLCTEYFLQMLPISLQSFLPSRLGFSTLSDSTQWPTFRWEKHTEESLITSTASPTPFSPKTQLHSNSSFLSLPTPTLSSHSPTLSTSSRFNFFPSTPLCDRI